MTDLEQIIEALGITFELAGQELRPNALAVLATNLEPYGAQRVLAGLNLCQIEIGGRLTPAVIIEKIQQADGRPGVGEAWALAVGAADERATVVWTAEIAQAWSQASALYEFDKFGARKAFEEAYQRATRQAISTCKPVSWQASIGWDAQSRDAALTEAVTAGRLTHDAVAGYLQAPPAEGVGAVVAGLLTGKLPACDSHVAAFEKNKQRQRLADARDAIYAGQRKRAEEAAKRREQEQAHKREQLERAKNHPLMVGAC